MLFILLTKHSVRMVGRELRTHVIAALRCDVLLEQLQCRAANSDVTFNRERTLEDSEIITGDRGRGRGAVCGKLEAVLRFLLCSSVLLL